MKRWCRLILALVLACGFLLISGCSDKQGSQGRASLALGTLRKAPCGDIEVGYRECGRGNPIVLIAGFGASMQSWDPLFVACLAENHRVIAPDNRGVGETPAGTKPFTIGQFAEDTAVFIKALELNKPDILGFSMGGMVVEELAIGYGDAVGKVILYATSCGGSQAVPAAPYVIKLLLDTSGTQSQRMQRLIEVLFPSYWLAAPKNRERVMAGFEKGPGLASPETAEKQIGAVASWTGSYDRLPGVKSLSLLVTGTEDLIIPPQNSDILASRLTSAKVERFPRAGHGLEYQYPEKLAASVVRFLE